MRMENDLYNHKLEIRVSDAYILSLSEYELATFYKQLQDWLEYAMQRGCFIRNKRDIEFYEEVYIISKRGAWNDTEAGTTATLVGTEGRTETD